MIKNPETQKAEPLSVRHPERVVVLFGEVLADVFPDRSVLGGAPFNVACHLRAFGLFPLLITRIGDDPLGRELMATMTRLGMTTEGVQQDSLHPTGQVIVHIENGDHRFEIPPDQAYDFIDANDARKIALSAAPELIYFGSLAQRNEFSFNALNNIFQTVQSRRILDINLREPWYTVERIQHSLSHAEVVKMSEDELKVIAGLLNISGNDEYAQAGAVIRQFSLQQLLVTCGERGVWQLDADGNKQVQQGGSIDLVDTVGAGDAFTAVFITGTLRGWSNAEILSRANAFAAAICGVRGAIPAEPGFYDSFLRAWGESAD
ncbi:MAG: fructokinase [Nitrosomonas sp.]|nr:MAG: fructokinase [Nitrosomonas sp.]